MPIYLNRAGSVAIATALLATLPYSSGIAQTTTAAPAKSTLNVDYCLDPVREIVTIVQKGACQGRVISPEKGKQLRESSRARIRKIIRKTRPPAALAELQRSRGSGFFVTPSGLVLTNNHVVQRCGVVTVETADGQVAPGRLRAVDAKNDLALVKVSMVPKSVASFSKSIDHRPGQRVATIGFPVQGLSANRAVYTTGYTLAGKSNDGPRPYYPVRLRIFPGNSGGPLLNESGDVSGVVVGKLDSQGVFKKTGKEYKDVGFAIKNDVVRNFLTKHNVSYKDGPGRARLTKDQILLEADKYVARVICWN